MLYKTCLRGVVILAGLCAATAAGAEPAVPRYQLLLKMPPALGVRSVALSPDESLLATDGGESGVLVYDAATGELLRTIDRVGDGKVVFSPDGRHLAAAGFRTSDGSKWDASIHLCDVQTGKVVRTFAGHTEIESYSIAFSPDGRLLASGGKDKQILVWEVATGAARHKFAAAFPVSALAFSPDSSTLASGGGDRTVRLWDMDTGKPKRSLAGHRDWISALAFSHDGRQIASASCQWGFHRGHDWPLPVGSRLEQSEWKLWDVSTGELKRTVSEPGRLLSLAFTPDDGALVCGIDRDVRLYEAAKDAPPRVVTSHDGLVTAVAVSRDGASVFSGSHDHTVKRVRLEDGTLERRLPGYREQVCSVSLSQDASLLAAATGDMQYLRGMVDAGAAGLSPGAIRLWDARTGRLIHRLGNPDVQFFAAALSPDGRLVAGGGVWTDGSSVVQVSDTATGIILWSMNDHGSAVLALAISPDGASLASASADGEVKLRDLHRGAAVYSLEGHLGGATSLAFSTDGSFFVCGAGNGVAHVWETRTGRRVRTCPAEGARDLVAAGDRIFNNVGLSQNGELLAASRVSVWNQTGEPVKLWDPRTGALVRDFSAEKIQGRPMALSPDGTMVATGGKSISLYDVRTGKRLRELFGRLKRTQSITFSSDGRLLVAGGNYGTINVWEVATGRHLVTLFTFAETHSGSTGSSAWLAATPDGEYTGSDGVERYLSWRVGDELQTPATPGLQLRRPKRVEAALELPAAPAAGP